MRKLPSSGVLNARRSARSWKRDAIEDALIGGQIREHEARREVGRLERRRTGAAQHVLELLGRGVFDEHPRRPIGAAPDDGASRGDVAGGDALLHRRTGRIGLDDRRGGARLGRRRVAQDRSGRTRLDAGLDQPAPRDPSPSHYLIRPERCRASAPTGCLRSTRPSTRRGRSLRPSHRRPARRRR